MCMERHAEELTVESISNECILDCRTSAARRPRGGGITPFDLSGSLDRCRARERIPMVTGEVMEANEEVTLTEFFPITIHRGGAADFRGFIHLEERTWPESS